MDVLITGRGVEIDSALKAYIRRRIDFALSRFPNKVGRICVVVTKKNGPWGGIEKSCRIRVQLLGNSTVTVSYSDNDVHVAIAHTADQIHRVVARKIEFGRTFEVTEQIESDKMGGIEEK